MLHSTKVSLTQIIRKSTVVFSAAILLCTASCSKDSKNDVKPTPTTIDTVSTYSGRVQLAYKMSTNADPACFVNLANGTVYKVSQAKDHAPEIDMLWGTRTVTPSQKYLLSVNESGMLTAAGADPDLWRESNLFTGWSKRNNTLLNNFAANGFNDITTRAQLMDHIGYHTGLLTYIPFDATADDMAQSFSYDITHNGVKYVGVLKITKSDLADGYADFTIKVVRVL